MNLKYNRFNKRNLVNISLTTIAWIFSILAITPLILVVAYVIIKGSSQINLSLFSTLPEPPGDDLMSAGGLGNALQGTLIITMISSLISIPIGVGGGITTLELQAKGLELEIASQA